MNSDAHSHHYQATIDTSIGTLGIRTTDTALTGVDFLPDDAAIIKPKTQVAKETILQIQCYLADSTFKFDIPLQLDITPFQQSVIDQLVLIPVGTTTSYTDIAEKLSSGPRPVGQACKLNPIPIIIPCHRVISKTGIGGYSGETEGPKLAIKHWLLSYESTALQDS